MEKTSYSQLELFSQSSNGNASTAPGAGNAVLGYLWHYEKAILLVIGFLITAVISFSLGVEKGRHVSLPKGDLPVTRAQNLTPQPAAAVSQQASASKQVRAFPQKISEPVVTNGPLKPKLPVQAYTIQLASYQTKQLALQEADALRKKGHTPIMLSKNGYTIVCVGSFSSKDTASALLTELKKYYKDCFIRRL